MIQSILFFALGFLCAGFLVLMIAPAIWRRAVTLTRKRIEASMPLSPSEIQADKDRLRAEFAMSTRRLEMSLKSLRDKVTAQTIEIDRNRAEMMHLAARRAETDEALSEGNAKNGELRAELDRRDDQIRQFADRLAEAERLLEQRALEFDKLGRMYDEALLISSNRQIELVARETEVDGLAGDMSLMRNQRKDNERRLQDVVAENRSAREALKVEAKKVGDLEKKVERLMTTLADREEQLDRRERELARLRDGMHSGDEPEARTAETRNDAARPEANVAAAGLRMSTLLAGAEGEDTEKAVAKLKEDRDRLEARLTALTRTNRKLRTDLAAQGRPKSGDTDDERHEDALLREEIHDLAAEVVSMTAAVEGPDSPIRGALAMSPPGAPADPRDRITSLADRVKALEKTAPAN